MEKKSKIKTRIKFSALDLAAEVDAIAKTVRDCKIGTVYNLDNTTYLIKMGKANVRANLVIESGVRLHLLDNFVEKNEKPNGFTNKLRKHLRNLYVRDIEQIGAERVCKITIAGSDDGDRKLTYFLFLELYAKGNIIFTDADLRILTLIRPHAYSDTLKCVPGEIYPLAEAAKIFPEQIKLSPDQLLPEALPAKPTYGAVAAKLVPCAHQALIDVFLTKNGLKPGDKFDPKNNPKILQASADMLALYLHPTFKGGYLYFEQGRDTSFEVSPVPLDFVSSPDAPLWPLSNRKGVRLLRQGRTGPLGPVQSGRGRGHPQCQNRSRSYEEIPEDQGGPRKATEKHPD